MWCNFIIFFFFLNPLIISAWGSLKISTLYSHLKYIFIHREILWAKIFSSSFIYFLFFFIYSKNVWINRTEMNSATGLPLLFPIATWDNGDVPTEQFHGHERCLSYYCVLYKVTSLWKILSTHLLPHFYSLIIVVQLAAISHFSTIWGPYVLLYSHRWDLLLFVHLMEAVDVDG